MISWDAFYRSPDVRLVYGFVLVFEEVIIGDFSLNRCGAGGGLPQ